MRDIGDNAPTPWNLQAQSNTIANAGPCGSYFSSDSEKKFNEILLQDPAETQEMEWSDETWGKNAIGTVSAN